MRIIITRHGESEENRKNGVEFLEKVRIRTKKFVQQLKDKHKNQTILVISHSGPIRMLFCDFLNKNFTYVLNTVKIDNAGISIFKVEDLDSGTPDFAEYIKLKDAYAMSESKLAGV